MKLFFKAQLICTILTKAHNKKAKAAVGKKKKLGEASRQATVQKHVLLLEKVFKILDADGDSNISRSEFADGLGQDESSQKT